MKNFVRLLLSGIASVVLCACAPAARTPTLPAAMLMSDGWRVVAGDRSEMTSDCIGSMKTPLCVVDTMMACDAWSPVDDFGPDDVTANHFDPVCDPLRADPGNPGYAPRTFEYSSFNPKFFRLEYQAASFTVTTAMMTAPIFSSLRYRNPGEFDTRPGDLAVIVRSRIFRPPDDCIISPSDKLGWTLYRDGCAMVKIGEGNGRGWKLFASLRRDGPGGDWRVVELQAPYREYTWPLLEEIYGNTGWKK